MVSLLTWKTNNPAFSNVYCGIETLLSAWYRKPDLAFTLAGSPRPAQRLWSHCTITHLCNFRSRMRRRYTWSGVGVFAYELPTGTMIVFATSEGIRFKLRQFWLLLAFGRWLLFLHRAQRSHLTDVEATAGVLRNAILCPGVFLFAGFNYLHSAAGVVRRYLANTLQLEQVVSVWLVEMFDTVSLRADFI